MPEIWTHYAEPHWPRFYRYEVAEDVRGNGLRVRLNVYPSMPDPETRGRAVIGIAVVIGRYAYCVKWAHARMRREADRG